MAGVDPLAWLVVYTGVEVRAPGAGDNQYTVTTCHDGRSTRKPLHGWD
jgi:hypothetical protein